MTDWTLEQQKEHRALLVAALRSGKYQQGKNQLRKGDAFCCLGVACDISGIDEWEGFEYAGKECALPRAVQDWLGFSSNNGLFGEPHNNCLAYLNDGGTPFSKIADIIESEPPGLIAEVPA